MSFRENENDGKSSDAERLSGEKKFTIKAFALSLLLLSKILVIIMTFFLRQSIHLPSFIPFFDKLSF